MSETDEFGGVAVEEHAPETDEFGGVAVAPEKDEFGGIATGEAAPEAGTLAKVAGMIPKSANRFNQGIEEGVASTARGIERLEDLGPRPHTFTEYNRENLRASEMPYVGIADEAAARTPWMKGSPYATKPRLQLDQLSAAARDLDAERAEQSRQLMAPAAALREAATQSAQEFGQAADETTGYTIPGSRAAGAMLLPMAAGFLPVVGGPAAAALGGLQTGGDVWQQAHDYYVDQGYSEEQATAIADKIGGEAGASNAALFAGLPGAGNTLAGAIVREHMALARPGLQALARTGLAAGQAGAIMGLDTATRDLQAAQTYRPDLTLGQGAVEVGESALTGGLLGGAMHGIHEAAHLPPGPDNIGKSFAAAREGQVTAAEMEAGAQKEAAAEEGTPEAAAEGTPAERLKATVEGALKKEGLGLEPELTEAQRLHVDNVQAEADKVRPGVKVVYEPGRVNHAGKLMDGWYDPNGEIVLNAGEIRTAEKVRRIVGEEWGHAKLATPDGQAALTEYMESHPLKRDQVLDLARAGYLPRKDESTASYTRMLHEEFVAKHGREKLGWFGDMVDRFAGYAKGKLGLDLSQSQAARALLRKLDPRVGTDENGHVGEPRASLRTDEFDHDETMTEPAPTTLDDRARVVADYQRYQQLAGGMRGLNLDQAQGAAAELEQIKNRYGGMPPPSPEDMRQSLVEEEQRRRGTYVTVNPVVEDTLNTLEAKEVNKRLDSLKMSHLRQVISDIAEAFGLPIYSRKGMVSAELSAEARELTRKLIESRGYKISETPTVREAGALSDADRLMGVGHRIELGTEDQDLARIVAGLIGATAPQVSDGAVTWMDDAAGPHFRAEVKPRSKDAALRMIDEWQARHPEDDFTYDPSKGILHTVLKGATQPEAEQSVRDFVKFVERHKNEGNVAKAEAPAHRQGYSYVHGPESFQQAIRDARAYASSRPAGERDRINGVAARASDRLKAHQAGLLTKAAALDEMARRPAPAESASEIGKALSAHQAAVEAEAAKSGESVSTKKFKAIRQFARFLDQRFQRNNGFKMYKMGSEEGLKAASKAMVYDILDGLSRDGSGKGWYDDRVRAMMQEMVKLHPQLETSKEARGVFAAILACTSQGYSVDQNLVLAELMFRKWEKTGRIPTDRKLAMAMDPINKNLAKVQAIIDTKGMPWFLRFMDREVNGGYLRDKLLLPGHGDKKTGMQSGVNLGDTVRGARILGPKIGSFFGNLRGRFDTVTMDLWYTRTMHRYLGETRKDISGESVQHSLDWFRDEVKRRRDVRGKGDAAQGQDKNAPIYDVDENFKTHGPDKSSDDEAIEQAYKVFNGWSQAGYPDDTVNKQPESNLLERAARGLKKNAGDMRGIPQNPSTRKYFADILLHAQADLASRGIHMTPADMQAILWFREKNLFAHAGVASDAAKPADFLDAVMSLREKIANKEGIWAHANPEDLQDLTAIKGEDDEEKASLVDEDRPAEEQGGGLRGGVAGSLRNDPSYNDAPRFSLVDDLGEQFKRGRRAFQVNLSPQNIDSQAKRFANGLRELNGEQAINLVRSAKKLEELRDFFDRTPVMKDWKYDPAAPLPKNYQVMAALETNRAALPPNLQEFARIIDEEFAHRIAEVRRLQPGAMAQLINDYFPHMWERPQSSAVANFMAEVAGRTPLAGSKAFMKQRSLPTIMEGLARGLKPIHDNPVDLVLAKMHQMDKFILSAELLQEAKASGMLKFFRLGQRIPDGMRIVDDKAGTVFAPPAAGGAGPQLVGHWALPDGAAQVLENHLSPGLQKFWAYRTARAASNILNGAQLGFSAFHLGFTSMDATVSSLATAVEYLLRGRMGPALKTAAATAPAAALNYYFGKAVQARMVDPSARGVKAFGMQVPLSRNIEDMVGKVAQLAVTGGLRAEQDPFWKTAFTRKLVRALHAGGVENYAKAGMAAPFALIEQSVRPIAEYLVPRQKLGVFGQLAMAEMDRIGWGAGKDETRAAMARAADSTEDRMGQMTYDNMFYNRMVKDAALLAFRAYGWQLGKYRAMFGAGVDTVRAGAALGSWAKGGPRPQITNRMLYPVALTAVAAVLGAIVHRMMTGKNPDSFKDVLFPQTGQVNPDGTPARVMLPTYLKDLAGEIHAGMQGPGAFATATYHKLNPALSGIADMWNNKDFFGTEIVDPSDPLPKRALDYGLYAAKLFAPFSLTGAAKLYEQGSPAAQLLMPFIGITPAKKAVLMSSAESLAADLYRETFPMAARSRTDAEHAALLRDIVKELKAQPGTNSPSLAKAQAAGLLRDSDQNRLESMMSGQAPLAYQASKLPPREAMRVWRLATADERATLFPIIADRLGRAANMDAALRTKLIAELLRDRPKGM